METSPRRRHAPVGVMAGVGLYALDNNVQRLSEDHHKARRFADTLRRVPGVRVIPEGDVTNIVLLDLSGTGVEAHALADDLMALGIRLSVEGTFVNGGAKTGHGAA